MKTPTEPESVLRPNDVRMSRREDTGTHPYGGRIATFKQLSLEDSIVHVVHRNADRISYWLTT